MNNIELWAGEAFARSRVVTVMREEATHPMNTKGYRNSCKMRATLHEDEIAKLADMIIERQAKKNPRL